MNENAVQWRVLDQTMTESCTGFADGPPEAVEALVDEAMTSGRKIGKAAASKTV